VTGVPGNLQGVLGIGLAGARPAARTTWLITFTDLIALMLTFFVMLFAMSKVEHRQWQNLTEALSHDLDAVQDQPVALPSEQLDIENVEAFAATDLDYLAALLRENMTVEALLEDAALWRLQDRLVVALPGELLFPAGSIELAPPGREALRAFGGLLRHVANRLEVTAYADPRPPGDGFASNWELSLARALGVAHQLEQSGVQGAVVARGLGDSRFAALSSRLGARRRLALGRRIELVVRSSAGGLP
jgi:chemotaxis protein MotB